MCLVQDKNGQYKYRAIALVCYGFSLKKQGEADVASTNSIRWLVLNQACHEKKNFIITLLIQLHDYYGTTLLQLFLVLVQLEILQSRY